MPEVSVTKGAIRLGWQTYARASKLPEHLRGAELDYLDMRDAYTNALSHLAQWEEARVQAVAARDKTREAECVARISSLQGILRQRRERVKEIGQKSYAEAFYLAAEAMLSTEARRLIDDAAERMLGRCRDELRTQRK